MKHIKTGKERTKEDLSALRKTVSNRAARRGKKR